MRIAVFGDIHGHWRDFRDAVLELQSQAPLDLVLQCGDAQPFRNQDDLEYMHCPKKYRELGDFWMFHEGTEEFPYEKDLNEGNEGEGYARLLHSLLG